MTSSRPLADSIADISAVALQNYYLRIYSLAVCGPASKSCLTVRGRSYQRTPHGPTRSSSLILLYRQKWWKSFHTQSEINGDFNLPYWAQNQWEQSCGEELSEPGPTFTHFFLSLSQMDGLWWRDLLMCELWSLPGLDGQVDEKKYFIVSPKLKIIIITMQFGRNNKLYFKSDI